jgi:hypothetical protein
MLQEHLEKHGDLDVYVHPDGGNGASTDITVGRDPDGQSVYIIVDDPEERALLVIEPA